MKLRESTISQQFNAAQMWDTTLLTSSPKIDEKEKEKLFAVCCNHIFILDPVCFRDS